VIRLDLPRGQIDLRRDDLGRLRDAAADQAGRSSAARDLSLILDRALDQRRTVTLRRGELHALIHVAADAGLGELTARLEDAAGTSPS
jgi:hypothetical protein